MLWSSLAFALALPSASLAGVQLAGDGLDFAASRLVAVGVAVLTAAGAIGWAAAYTRAARHHRRTTTAVWIATACLALGLGSIALSSWEEYQAGTSLPIINLFLLLIPIGLLTLLGAAVAQTLSARGERQR